MTDEEKLEAMRLVFEGAQLITNGVLLTIAGAVHLDWKIARESAERIAHTATSLAQMCARTEAHAATVGDL